MDFVGISLLLVTSAIFGVLAKFAKQPLLVGYLFAGATASYFGLLTDHGLVEALGKIGVTLLLFLVGLEMNLKDLPTVGKTALVTGVGQIAFTLLFGFILSSFLGFSTISSLYIGAAMAFSSTIIIIKLFSEKKVLDSLYGKISVGFLLVQDLVAVLVLMFLAGLKEDGFGVGPILLMVFKAVLVFAATWYLSKKILPLIFERIVGHSTELLFIVSIAWALGVSSLMGGPLGFSFEIGGFLAGLALSNIPEHLGVASRTKPLRDFFLTIFFLSLGSQLLVGDISSVIVPSIFLSLLVIIGNPIIVMSMLGILGYKKRTSFFSSVAVAQISEFSFILMAMGLSLGHVTSEAVSTVILVGAITMTLSTYLILGSEKIFKKIQNFISFFERRKTNESAYTQEVDFSEHVVLVGCDKIGSSMLSYFRRRNIPLVVIDFDPGVFKRLSSENTSVLLGDATDSEILELAKITSAKLIICTIPNVEENLSILETIKSSKNKPIYIGSAQSREDSVRVYEAGADYVLNPDIIAGEFLRHIFLHHGFSVNKISKMGKNHFNRLMYLKPNAKTKI
ncbi:MAG: cation:proton antiporter [bacterium]|nr:MAG: cation:proton antiporter [bacterium]